jgi:hypothetical protein
MVSLKRLILVAFFIAFGISYLGPVMEGDFFWHLAEGRAIWEGGGPSAWHFPTQWLGQLMLYSAWKVSGFGGIVVLRALLYISILGLLYFFMRKRGAPFFLCLFFLLFPGHILLSFPNERPQLFSFFLFSITLLLLEDFRLRRTGGGIALKGAYRALPFIFVVWANIHAGFLLGMACAWIYLIDETVSYLKGKTTKGRLFASAFVSLSPLLILTLKPGTLAGIWDMSLSMLFPDAYVKSMVEYLSPATALLKLGQYYPAYWIFLCITLFTLIMRRREMPFSHIALAVFLAALSLRSLRFMPFLTMIAPFVALRNIPKKTNLEDSRLLLSGFGCIVVLLFLFYMPKDMSLGINREFPKGAVSFLREKNPGGKIFDYHGWAGYLKWELPGREIFIPVEGVSKEVDNAYGKILWANSRVGYGGMPEWRALLDAYGLDVIAMPGMSPVSGEIYPLIKALIADNDWYLVYSDATANIFLRASDKNAGIIRVYSRPKSGVYLQIALQAERLLKEDPKNKAFRNALLYSKKKLKE